MPRGDMSTESATLPLILSIFMVVTGHFCVGTGEGIWVWTKLKVMRKMKQTLKMSIYYEFTVSFRKKKINVIFI